MTIPKIIHQVWEGRTESKMPTRLKFLAQTWKDCNPNWEYHLWNGDEMDSLVATFFSKYSSMYKNFSHNVQRWDTIRYMILNQYGGVYADLDSECFRPIETLMDDVVMGFGEEPPLNETKPTRIGNALMASKKECKGWIVILNEILSKVEKKESAVETVMNSTGPNMINHLYPLLEREYGACSFSYTQVTPVSKYDMYRYIYQGERSLFHSKIEQAFCAHYFFGSWDDGLSLYI